MHAKQINNISNATYLKGIADNDLSILKKIYSESLPEVVKYVKRNSGTLDDAKDVFQEGILVIYKKVKEDKLVLTTEFHVFLFIVCKRIWLKKIKKKSNKEVTLEGLEEYGIEDNFEEQFIQTRKWKLFNEKFQLLAEECREVLKMFFKGASGKDISDKMGYSPEYAKRKKYKCKLSLAGLIKNDPEYKNLTTF